jgi:AcrR family transcriptional regulator
VTRRSPRTIEQIEAQLLMAALALGDSLDATSMPRLAHVAGIAVGTLYRIAPSKAALGARLEEIAWARFDTCLFAPFPARLDIKARFELMFERLMRFASEQTAVARFLATRPMPDRSAFLRASAVFARDGAAAGLFKPLSGHQIAALVWGPLAVLLRNQEPGKDFDRSVSSSLEPSIWDALCNPPRSR